MPNTARDWSGSESNRAVLVRFQMPKQLNLIAQLGAGMQDLKSCSESCSRFVVSLSGELRHLRNPIAGRSKSANHAMPPMYPAALRKKIQDTQLIARTISAAMRQPR